LRVFAPNPFRWPVGSGIDYPYGKQDIGDDSIAHALVSAGLVFPIEGAFAPAPSVKGDLLTPSGSVLAMTHRSSVNVALFGDSRCAMDHHLATPTQMSRTNGIASVTIAGHGLASNKLVNAVGLREQPSLNANSVKVTRVDANTFSYPSAGPDIAPFTPNTTFSRIVYLEWQSNLSRFQFANGNPKVRGAMRLVDNFGCSSEQTPDMIARLPVVGQTSADLVMYDGGVNDTTGTAAAAALSAAATIANDVTIVEYLLAQGKVVALGTIMPLGNGHTAFAAAMPKIVQINAARRELARRYHGRVFLVDFWAALIDPVNGYARTDTLQSDKVHLQTYGAHLGGDEWANAMPWLSPARALTASSAEARANYAVSPNLWPAGQWAQVAGGTQTGATNGTPAGGEVAGVMAGMNVTVTGASATTVIRPETDANGNVVGFLQVVQVTPTGAGTVEIQADGASIPMSPSGVAILAGQKFRPSLRLKLNNVTSKVQYPRVKMNGQFTGAPDSAAIQIGTPFHSDAPAVDGNLHADVDLYLTGPDIEIPPFATYTAQNLEVIVAYSGATTPFELCAGRIAIDQVA
jgi:lysophospholipase L1-like esterase